MSRLTGRYRRRHLHIRRMTRSTCDNCNWPFAVLSRSGLRYCAALFGGIGAVILIALLVLVLAGPVVFYTLLLLGFKT